MHEQRTTNMHRCQCMKFSRIISGCPAGARKWRMYNKKDFRSNAEVLF